jgi:hypothetical protein
MAYLAVDKDGTEIISEYSLYRNGYYNRYKKCDPVECDRCFYSGSSCKIDKDGKRYSKEIYNSPPKMNREKAIEVLSFWDNFEFDPDCNRLDYTVILPKGSIQKLIGRELTWEDEPVELE